MADGEEELERLLVTNTEQPTHPRNEPTHTIGKNTFWLARDLVLKSLGVVHFFAFLSIAFQGTALFGEHGVEPRVTAQPSRPAPFFALVGVGDRQLELACWLGVLLSLHLIFAVPSTCLVPAGLWILFLSIVNLSSSFISSYGWEWQLLETTFLASFLLPLKPTRSRLSHDSPPSAAVIWLLRWLAFRVMFGAGLSKIGPHSSMCWLDLTCTATHYETQPNPNPIAWFAHRLPLIVHKFEVIVNHIVELVVVWGFLIPNRNVQITTACIQFAFQFFIAISGNYAYINWITCVAFFSCLDDAFLSNFFLLPVIDAANEAETQAQKNNKSKNPTLVHKARTVVEILLVLLIVWRSYYPIRDTLNHDWWLNFYDDYFLVNQYGVFGFVNTKRFTTVLEYSHGNSTWKALDFPCYSGSVDRMPCVVQPYHYRFDWDLWIHTTASLESRHGFSLWKWRGFLGTHLKRLISMILDGQAGSVAPLIGISAQQLFSPHPPTVIRATLYQYHYSSISELAKGVWWTREMVDGAQATFHHTLTATKQPTLPPARDNVMLFCTIGIFVAVLALRAKFEQKTGNGLCDGLACSRLLTGEHSALVFNTPNALFGGLYFVFVFVCTWVWWSAFTATIVLGACVAACGVSVYLMVLLWKLREACVVCLLAHVCVFATSLFVWQCWNFDGY